EVRKSNDTTPRARCPNSAAPGAVKPGMDDGWASHSQIETLWNIDLWPSVDFGAGEFDHLRPLLCICGDERAEVGRRTCKHGVTKVGDPRLHPRVGKARIDLLIELVDDLGGCIPGRADPLPTHRLVAWHEFAHGRNVWQDLQPRCGGHRQRAQFARSDVLD